MNLLELIEEIGMENADLQVLSQALTGAKARGKAETVFSFVSDETIANVCPPFEKPKRAGLVLWIDSDKLQEAASKLKAKENGTDSDV